MKVGDYIRTKDGYISKIKELGINIYTDVGCWSKDYVIKSSPNIIDLIEVGDYVNGDKVEKNKYGELYTGYVYCGGEIGRTEESYTLFLKDMEEEDIESIVTQEQFERMEYKVGKNEEII